MMTRNIDLEDSGTGIDPQKIDKIFGSFYSTKPGTIFSFTLPTYHEEGAHAGVPAG